MQVVHDIIADLGDYKLQYYCDLSFIHIGDSWNMVIVRVFIILSIVFFIFLIWDLRKGFLKFLPVFWFKTRRSKVFLDFAF